MERIGKTTGQKGRARRRPKLMVGESSMLYEQARQAGGASKPVKINAAFDTAMGAFIAVRPSKKRRKAGKV